MYVLLFERHLRTLYGSVLSSLHVARNLEVETVSSARRSKLLPDRLPYPG
jgi:hypothetical protein